MKKRIPKGTAYIVAGIALIIIFIILLNRINTASLSVFFTKAQKGISGNIYYIKDTFKSIKYVSSAKNGIQALSEKNVYLELQNQSLISENERLKAAILLKSENKFKKYMKCYATIVDANDDGFVQFYLIDKGAQDNVSRGDGVVSGDGVLGRVYTIMPDTSRVQLLTDAESRISVRVERNKIIGILIGKGLNICELDYIPKEEDIIEGDVLVTSGLGKSFPEGIKVGRVIKVDKKTDSLSMIVRVKPFVNVFRIQEVMVVGK